MSEFSQKEYRIKDIASNVRVIKDQFNTLRSTLDWDVKSRSGIDMSMRDIHRGLSELDNDIMRLGDFIRSSKDAYENAEKKINAELANLNNLFKESPGSTYEARHYPVNDNGRNPLETSLEHIGDLFRRIGQAIVNMFVPQKDPKELLDLANNFINGNPHRGIAYRAVVDVDIPPVTGGFEYAFRPVLGIDKGDSKMDKADTMGTQEDSFRGDGLNLYAYVQNNPINFIDPSGYSSRETSDTYRSVDLTNGMYMYDPNSQVATYIHDVQRVTYALTEPLIDSAYRSPTAGNLYPPMQFKPTVVELIYEELGFAVNNKKNEPAIIIALKVVKEAEDIYKSIQEGVSVGGPNAIAVGVTSVASYLYKKNPDNIAPGYLQDYLFNIWSNKNRKSLIINVSKALYIRNTEFKYLINSVGAREKFIERLNTIRDSVDGFDLSGFDETTQNNIRYLSKNAINRIIEMNNNNSDSVKFLENKLNRIEQDIKEKLH